MSSSTVFRGGAVVDGTGAPARVADVLVEAGRISAVLPSGSRVRGRPVDITGLVIAPGFIDMHSHSDLAVLADAEHLAKTLQGVTLEVCGQDGLSYAPVTDQTMPRMRHQLAGWNGLPDLDYTWRTVGDYLDRVDQGSPVNVAYLVPHGTVRHSVVGEADRPATDSELRDMQRLVAMGLSEGAVGLSTGLTYAPAMFADDDEIVALCQPVRAVGGYHCTHHRNYGARVVDAYQEALDLGRRAGVALHLAHCHVNFPQNRGRAGEVLEAVDRARVDGLDVTLDSYPYTAGATYLSALLPSWIQQGDARDIVEQLRAPETRSRLIHELEVVGSDGHHGVPMDWNSIVLASAANPALRSWTGRTIADLARERGAPPGQLFLDLLIADELRSGCLVTVGNEENVRTVMSHAVHTVGTDGLLIGDSPHPRGWGTFPRILGFYVREIGLFSLEAAIEHMTSRAARRLGFTDRGRIAVGSAADLVVLDPRTVGSDASYDSPRRAPSGIIHVLVNGEFTVRDGRRTCALPGRSLRAGGVGARAAEGIP